MLESIYDKPKFDVGDTISWVCDTCRETHTAKVTSAVPGFTYDCPHYEVLAECCGEEKTMYVDEWDVLKEDALGTFRENKEAR